MAAPLIDWDLAVRLGTRLAGDGPTVSREEARDVVAELREDAARSARLVRDHTRLEAPENTAPVLVVDRAGWVQANADSFATVLAPLVTALESRRTPTGLTRVIGSRVTGAEAGALLGFLAGKVLGQFDPFHTGAESGTSEAGRLLLVAPNIVHVERELGAVPGDFRLWVCLHEETHRVQFTAVPWLRDHLFSEVQALADTLGGADVAALLDDGLKRVTELVRGGTGSIIDVVSTPEQRAILDRVTGLMSLLEGHADVVMDGVGPSVIPSVDAIRRKFTQRRQGVGTLDRLLRRLLGLDAKMAQYRDGAVFVRTVVDRVGMERFNVVFAEPAHLPSLAEIHDPPAWIGRVLG